MLSLSLLAALDALSQGDDASCRWLAGADVLGEPASLGPCGLLDACDRILLCRFAIPEPIGMVIRAAPGGGAEHGETPLAALRLELCEEIGLAVDADPPHVWHQRVVAPGTRLATTAWSTTTNWSGPRRFVPRDNARRRARQREHRRLPLVAAKGYR